MQTIIQVVGETKTLSDESNQKVSSQIVQIGNLMISLI